MLCLYFVSANLLISFRKPFKDFSTNAAIQCTELYEYCQTLGGRSFSIPSFQVERIFPPF